MSRHPNEFFLNAIAKKIRQGTRLDIGRPLDLLDFLSKKDKKMVGGTRSAGAPRSFPPPCSSPGLND
jgi:hypothetical protein